MSTETDIPELDGEAVALWLAANPDFLAKRPDLLAKMDPPDLGGGGVVDLQRFMVERHRQELVALKDSWQELLTVSRANLSSQATIFEATLSAIRAASFENLVETVTDRFPEILHCECVTLCIEGEDALNQAPTGVRRMQGGDVDAYLGGADKLSRFISDLSPDPMLFGPSAGVVQSAALVRLDMGVDGPKALLAIGGRESDAFTPDQADDLLTFLGQALGGTFAAWLDYQPEG
jgi:uncharacterized protein YigA (DUF484 family)